MRRAGWFRKCPGSVLTPGSGSVVLLVEHPRSETPAQASEVRLWPLGLGRGHHPEVKEPALNHSAEEGGVRI